MKPIKGYPGYYIDVEGTVYSNRKGTYKPLKVLEERSVRLVNPDDSKKRKIVRISKLYMQAYNKVWPGK